MGINTFLFEKINELALKYFWLDTLAIFFAQYFEWILICFLILFLIKERKKFFYLFSGVFLSVLLSRGVITEIVRYFFPVSRPFVENNVNLLISHSALPAFPSGHAAFYFALATYVFLYNKKIYPASSRRLWCGVGVFFLLASFLISFSRIFVGIHWPLDILGGILVGVFSALTVWYFQQRFLLKTKKASD